MRYVEDGEIKEKTVPTLSALNLDLRDEYVADCANGVRRWNQALEDAGLDERLILPHEGFNRRVGVYAAHHVSPEGEVLSDDQWEAPVDGYLPSAEDRQAVADLMVPEYELRQVRRLDRPAPGRHQRPARRVRLRAPRRRGRGVRCRPHLDHEPSPTWDADKQRVIGSAPAGALDLSYADGAALPGDWWAARTPDGVAVGYGWLDATWGGDAEILLAVDASAQQQGVGSFVIAQLEEEAARRGLNYVYNTVRDAHPQRDDLHDWLAVRGYRGGGARGTRRCANGSARTSSGPRSGPGRRRRSRPRRGPTTRRPTASVLRATRSPAATSTSTTTGTDRCPSSRPDTRWSCSGTRSPTGRPATTTTTVRSPTGAAARPPRPVAGWPGAGPALDLVVRSPATRAGSTWDLVAAQLSTVPAVRVDDRVYAASLDDLLAVLAELPEDAATAVLVGHNPGLEELVEHLTGEPVRMPTSAVAVVDVPGRWSGVADVACTLRTSGRPPS